MAVLKCKMCGGDLEIQEGKSTCECEYCGSVQTIPKLDDEKKLIQFERANKLRFNCEFDKAAGVYENIVSEFRDEAEAYWGLVLCKFGIEYVDDPLTAKKIPTCHRSSFESVMEDEDLELALENADIEARRVYRDEAKKIETLRRRIIDVSQNEEPYDIFICYKETDESGARTLDSVIAQDVYKMLTNEGYRVFFSRISLEDKIGQEYEPYIFAALNSAKIMLAFGTDYEYYNAVWVKNEWSRYLKLMVKDKTKHLIPCYKNLDAYDIPKEFNKLQAQDMGKIGAEQDLLRGIEKLIGSKKEEKGQPVSQPVVGNGVIVDNILKLGYMALEDGDFEGANANFEEALKYNIECAEAYLGKTMATFKMKNKSDLYSMIIPLKYNNNFKRVLKYASDDLKLEIENMQAAKEKEVKEEKRRRAEEAVRREAEEARRREEEARRKAEEARKREEEARKKAEEEARKKAEEARKKAEEAEKARKERDKKIKELKVIREKIEPFQNHIAVGDHHTVGLKLDGTVIAIGSDNSKQCQVYDWRNIVAVSAGDCHTVGLKSDGTVVATGDYVYDLAVSDWKDIVAVSSAHNHTVGLKSNGTVVETGMNYDYGETSVSGWKDIVAVSTGQFHTVGLKSDGTVVATGCNNSGECNVSDWEDIVAVSAGWGHTVGLKSDGTVVTTSHSGSGVVAKWQDIVAVSAGYEYTVGLKADGTVVVSVNELKTCTVLDWKDIVSVNVKAGYVVCFKSDGQVIFSDGNGNTNTNTHWGEDNIKDWNLFKNVGTSTSDLYKKKGLCPYCGGQFEGFILRKCIKCGRRKDY